MITDNPALHYEHKSFGLAVPVLINGETHLVQHGDSFACFILGEQTFRFHVLEAAEGGLEIWTEERISDVQFDFSRN